MRIRRRHQRDKFFLIQCDDGTSFTHVREHSVDDFVGVYQDKTGHVVATNDVPKTVTIGQQLWQRLWIRAEGHALESYFASAWRRHI